MDPYLEHPNQSNDFHLEMIVGIRAALNQDLRPGYYAHIDERVDRSGPDDPGQGIFVAPPGWAGAITRLDQHVHEGYLKVIDTSNRRIVTVIELLKPMNKVVGACGLESFRENRDRVMKSSRHWVEIDLLREGHSLMPREKLPDHEYLVFVSPSHRRPDGLFWPIRLSERLPVIPIPLRGKHETVPLDLQAVLEVAYDRARYELDIDYTKEPVPPLSEEWREWADRLLRGKGLRPPTAAG
jgi:hypothetical protein